MNAHISFKNDYAHLAHPRIMNALSAIGHEVHETYGEDRYSVEAARLIQAQIAQECDIHFVSGGTQANLITIGHMLKPYESVIACETGHICVHEAGAIEAIGHKINTTPHSNGKLTLDGIENTIKLHHDEHMVLPRVVFVSQSTELGSLYTKAELTEISQFCKKQGLYLYLDGARLGSALASQYADLTLSDIASLVDVFYIGGTKNGALFGEAIVIMNDDLKANYRFSLKQRGALLAKGMGLGIQFVELFKDGLFLEIGDHACQMAQRLTALLKDKDIAFKTIPHTNQIFPILPLSLVEKLEQTFAFYRWEEDADNYVTIRLVTSWATRPEDVDAFGRALV